MKTILQTTVWLDVYDTYCTSFFPKFSTILLLKIQRGLNLVEYVPGLARKVIARPAHNRHYIISCARGNYIIGLTRRQMSVPSQMKSVTNSSRNNAQRGNVSAIIALTALSLSATSVV